MVVKKDTIDDFFHKKHSRKIIRITEKIPITKKNGKILIMTLLKDANNFVPYIEDLFSKPEMFNKTLFKGYILPSQVDIKNTIDRKFMSKLNIKISDDYEKLKHLGFAKDVKKITTPIRILDKDILSEASQSILSGENNTTINSNVIFDLSTYFSIIESQRGFANQVLAFDIFVNICRTVAKGYDKVFLFTDDTDYSFKSIDIIKKTSKFTDRFKHELLMTPEFFKFDSLIFKKIGNPYIVHQDLNELKKLKAKVGKFNKNAMRLFIRRLHLLDNLTVDTKSTDIDTLWKKTKSDASGFDKKEVKSLDDSGGEDSIEVTTSAKVSEEIPKAEIVKSEKDQKTLLKSKPTKDVNLDDFFGYYDKEAEARVAETEEAKIEEAKFAKLEEENRNMTFTLNGKEVDVKALREFDPLDVKIEENDYSKIMPTKKLAKIKNVNFSKQYMKSNAYYSDLVKVLDYLKKDKDSPIYLTDLKIEDRVDTESSLQEVTYKIKTIINGKENTKTDRFLIPKLTDENTFHLNTTNYKIHNTMVPLPISKTGPNTAIINTIYNKLSLERFNRGRSRTSGLTDVLMRKINKSKDMNVKRGKSVEAYPYRTTMPLTLTELSKTFVKYTKGDTVIYTNRDKLKKDYDKAFKVIKKSKILLTDQVGLIPIGYNKKNGHIIVLDKNYKVIDLSPEFKGRVVLNDDLEDYLKTLFDIDKSMGTTIDKFDYIRIYAFSSKFPMVFLFGLSYSLQDMLKALKVRYKVIPTGTPLPDLKYSHKIMELRDYTVLYEDKIEAGLLLNGFRDTNYKDYNLVDLNKGGRIYIDYFSIKHKKYQKAINTIKKFNYAMEDPITQDILKQLKLPRDFLGLSIEAIKLLNNNKVNAINDMADRRIRPGGELVNALIYREVQNSIEGYKSSTSSRASLKGFGIRDRAIVNALTSANNVNPVKAANPMNEVEEQSKVSYIGPVGGFGKNEMINSKFREWHESMDGVLGLYSPDNSNVGAHRMMAGNPNVFNIRGMIDLSKKNENETSQLFGLAEYDVPFINECDPPRTMMVVKQATHAINIENNSMKYFSTGGDYMIAQEANSRYCFCAKQDGRVERIDSKKNLIHLKYADGTKDTVNLNETLLPQKEDTIYINSTLTIKKGIRTGSAFKERDVLAFDHKYFLPDHKGNPVLGMGRMATVVIADLEGGFEDGIVMSSQFADQMVTSFSENKQISMESGSTIIKMASIGDHVEVDTPLINYSNSSGENLELTMDIFGEEDEIVSLKKTAKADGEIVDINIVYNVDKSELSKSLVKYINKLEKKKKEFQNSLSDSAKLVNPILFPKQIEGNKYNSAQFDGVLVEFYIKKRINVNMGDKFTATALKGTNAMTTSYTQCPVTTTGIPIDVFINPNSVLARKVSNIMKEGRLSYLLSVVEKRFLDEIDEKKPKTAKQIANIIMKHLKAISPIDKDNLTYNYWKKELPELSNADALEYVQHIRKGTGRIMFFHELGITINWNLLRRLEKKLGINRKNDVILKHIEGGEITLKGVMLLKLPILRLKQIAYKKTTANMEGRNIINPVTGSAINKTASFSIPEIQGLDVVGMQKIIEENVKLRSDNPDASDLVKKLIREKGYVSLDDISNEVFSPPLAQNLINAYYISAGMIPTINGKMPLESHVDKRRVRTTRQLKKSFA